MSLWLVAGCDTSTSLGPPTNGDQGNTSNTQNQPKGADSTTAPVDNGDGGSNPPPPPPFVPPRIDAFVIKNRQKFIGLPAYIKGVEYDSFSFTVTTAPAHGQLIGSAPNLCYIPEANYTGYDQLTYRADSGGDSITLTLYISVGTDFVAPIGIPAPEFGVTQSHTMYLGATYDYNGATGSYHDAGNGPYTHYVDFDTGNDTGNPYGTAASPRKSIPEGLTPGSVVELHGTNVTTPAIHNIRGEGTLNQPIFIRGASPANKAVLRRNVVVEGNYIICENLEFDCRDAPSEVWFWITSTQVPPFITFHHVALRHSLFHDQPTMPTGNPCAMVADLVGFDPALDTGALQIENIVAYDLEVRNFSQWDNFAGGQDYVGVVFGTNTQNCWALDCHLHHLHSTGVSVCRCNGTPNMTPPNHIYAGRNYVHNVKEQCIVFKNAVDCVCSQNVCHTVRVSDSSVGTAIPILNNDGTADWPGSDEIWVLFNTVYDCERGVFHNLTAGLLPGGVLPPGRLSRSYVIGNTFFDIRAIRGSLNSFGMAVFNGNFSQSRLINNLVRDCSEGFRLGVPGMATPEVCGQ
ncbi:MAG TPA: Ig-like domain-containing protein, partial [Phycisphaerae bacterium]|nr:Ig-like domain-containing protein [Phycisphaerae bacterium]